jgi:diguanylate cyclase (GGDEF)-like protein
MTSESSAGEVLGLRYGTERTVCALQPLAEKLLTLIRTKSCGNEPSADARRLAEEVEKLSRTLLAGRTLKNAKELTDPIVELCNKLLDSRPRPSNNREIAAALNLVREAVASIDGVERTLQRSLDESVDKFDALRRLNDIGQLKAGLERNVHALKAISTEREKRWRSQMQSVEQKVRTLETQLAETRLAAQHDALTGLVNRRTVEVAFKNFHDTHRQFVLALFDVDDFKRINDTFGHIVGDAALKTIASTVQTSVRSHDVVGRYGGDEFILMMVDVSLAQAEHRLRAIVQNIRAAAPVAEGAPALTVSCGVAECSSGDTFETLVSRADQALYDIKRAGKNRIGLKTKPFVRESAKS